ncbi:MAG: CpsD/CapB family tyrosine-protein kinase [Clostridia bacterium]|nr:CpsD/CapB family tyrosine-protein kinase [Clostridia bacterium]
MSKIAVFDKLKAMLGRRKSANAAAKNSPESYEFYNVLSPHSPYNVAESYRRLYANITYLPIESKCRKIAISSALSGEGKTTVSVNLAITLAQNLNAAKVLLIDTDLRKPGVELMLSKDFQPHGLAEFLSGEDEEPNIVTSSVAGLSVLYAGAFSETPTRLISSERMAELFRYCEERFDYIILDTPAFEIGSEALLLKNHINGYVLVAKSKNSDVDSLGKTVDSLRVLNAPIFGMVLTGAQIKRQKKRRFIFRRR